MPQKDLFNKYSEQLARDNDPITSHIAANQIIDEGTLGKMQVFALQLVRLNPGKTGSELDEVPTGRKGQVHKRLRELEKAGFIYEGVIRHYNVSGRLAVTWWPYPKERTECTLEN